MLSTPEFKEWSSNVVLLLHNTSRCSDEPYPNLLREKGGNGFPTLTYLDHTGRFLRQLPAPANLNLIRSGLRDLDRWKLLQRRARDGEAGANKQLYLLEVEFGMLTFGEAESRADSFSFSAEERAGLDRRLIVLEFQEVLRNTPRSEMASGGAKFYAMLQEGRIPNSPQVTSFWQYIFRHLASTGDVSGYETSLARMKKIHAGDKRLERYLPALEKQLEMLRRAKR